MENPGETLVADYLRYIKECEFVDLNVYTKKTQGEIDVIGINNEKKEVYVCEVVTHLITGIRYSTNRKIDTANKLIGKFTRDIEYAEEAFKGYKKIYMLWSPVVIKSRGKYQQFKHLKKVESVISKKTNITIEFVINDKYVNAINELRIFASNETKELKSPIMRFLQIEHYTSKNADRIKNTN